MPDRFLRDGLLTSASYNDLPIETQNLFTRLLLVADDFGAFDGREGVCASQCYPLAPPGVDQMARMLTQLHAAGLIVRYTNAGKAFIAIMQWKCGMRGRRKFPAPPVDVDLKGPKISGKWDRDPGWRNPPGYDDVSVLIDLKARPVNPQPDEWRPPQHYLPVEPEDEPAVAPRGAPGGGTNSGTSTRTHGRTRGATKAHVEPVQPDPATRGVEAMLPAMTHHGSHLRSHHGSSHLAVDGKQLSGSVVAGAVAADQPVGPGTAPEGLEATATPTPPINGQIKFKDGRIVGLTEAQRVEWQGMFDDLRIPDQVDRAGAWLAANPAEAKLYSSQDDGIHAFIVRWLLRESKPQA